MRLTDFDALTFDCYGTLIDWERGILDALRPLLDRLPSSMEPDRVLEDFAAAEAAQEAETPELLYRDVLTAVHHRLESQWQVTSPQEELATAFGASVPNWPAFADSPSSLMYLSKYYKLVILSNVDHQSFAGSQRRLQVDFDAVYTAEDIGSYKPDLRNFHYMIDRVQQDLGVDRSRILHTAQSLFHDHQPAAELGLARAWIDRRHDRRGWGATPAPDDRPDVHFHFHSMADLATAHQQALRAAD